MRIKQIFIGVLALGMLATTAVADVAVLDVVKVVNASNANKRAEKALSKRRDDAQDEVNKLEAPLLEKKRRLEERRSMVSQDQFLEEQAELRKEVGQFRAEAQKIQEDLQREALRRRKEIADAVNAVVGDIAREKKYSIVLPKNVLLYAGDSVDISDEVLKRINSRLDK